MAIIYFKNTRIIDGTYWKVYRVKGVAPSERSCLSLIIQEYNVIAGDIGSSRATVEG